MLTKVCHVILLTALVNAAAVQDITADDNYRLPDGTYDIENYNIDLLIKPEVIEGTETSYTGKVVITFSVKKETDNIQLHAPFEKIAITSLETDKNIPITISSKNELNETTGILTIKPDKKLTVGKYILTTAYTGKVDETDMNGLYKSTYDDTNGIPQYLLTTQLAPVYARKVFPCFDEPQYKATFDISITYPKGYNTLSNTEPKAAATEDKSDETLEKVTFTQTPRMSTYLVAFTISKFDCTTPTSSNSVSYKVCSKPGTEGERNFAQNYGIIILEKLGELTGINYNQHEIGKMDEIAIPDNGVGAMENYGLVTQREAVLLVNEDEATNYDKQRTLFSIAHEFAHMWFGNLVTLDWWDHTFLNEGFATVFANFALEKITDTEKWEISKQFVIDDVRSALRADAYESSAALASESNTPEEISNKFDVIGYSKGASILRMVYNILGDEKFNKGIKDYLDTNQHNNVKPSHLWTSFEKQTLDMLPESKKLEEVMSNWINKPGFPVVTVSATGDDVTLTQKRFLYDKEGKEDTPKYYVPIWYTTSAKSGDFKDTKLWLTPDKELKIESVLKDASWIFFNNQVNGYYRVNYDSSLWSKLKEVLQSKDRTRIDVLNRAQIVDDLFNLAKSNDIKYSDALNIINFLQDETDYYPWYSALNEFNALTVTFGESSEIGKALKNLQLRLIQNVHKEVPMDTTKPDQIYTLKQVMILENMCKLGEESCIATAKDLFGFVKNGTSLNKDYNNFKYLIYCNGLRNSDDSKTDYEKLFDLFQTTISPAHKSIILKALGCVNNREQVNQLLQNSISKDSKIRKQELYSVWNSVINSNPEGVDTALDFFIEKHADIIEYYPGSAQILATIASGFTKQEQVDKLKNFSEKDDVDESLKTIAKTSVEKAKNNLKWVSTVKNDFETYFDIKGAASGNIANIFVITFLLYVSMLFMY